jgi:hypothetical protein
MNIMLFHLAYLQRCGSVTIAVYGDEDKPALITYPDVALNCKCCRSKIFFLIHYQDLTMFISRCFLLAWADMSCFQGFFFCPEVASLLLHNFCVYHINPQGHEVSDVGSIPVTRCVVSVFRVCYLHDLCCVAFVKSPTDGSSSNVVRCAGAICC